MLSSGFKLKGKREMEGIEFLKILENLLEKTQRKREEDRIQKFSWGGSDKKIEVCEKKQLLKYALFMKAKGMLEKQSK